MEVIRLQPLEHRDQYCIAIVGSMTTGTYQAVHNFPGRRFSRTHGCWYVPYDGAALDNLVQQIGRFQPVEVSKGFRIEADRSLIGLPEGYHEQLVRLRYSEATWENYESQLRQFLVWLRPRTLDDLNDEVIKGYLFHLANDRKIGISTQNTAINAIKFYLEKVHRGERKVYYVDRPMKESKLPHVLTQDEVKRLISSTKNVKHRCILLVFYSTGIRMSELLNLRLSDFDPEKCQVFIRGGKGRKDRLTITSSKALTYIKTYSELYQPGEFLFEGAAKSRYSARSVNNIIKRAAKNAGIHKRVSAHTLRHSFATHLLEEGTDIRYIQMLMGHLSSKTTERYTHMTTRGFKSIKSPLDHLGLDFDVSRTGTQNE